MIEHNLSNCALTKWWATLETEGMWWQNSRETEAGIKLEPGMAEQSKKGSTADEEATWNPYSLCSMMNNLQL